jgi:hypothetical protein
MVIYEEIEYDEPHNSSINCCTSSSSSSNKTFASPAFAGGYKKRDKYGDSSTTITVQKNKQKQVISGDGSEGIQNADNCIAVLKS